MANFSGAPSRHIAAPASFAGIAGNTPTMTSREIAELTGKEHFNVMRDIRTMLAELKEDALKFEAIYLDAINRPQTEYHLDRELTETLLTGYSAVLRRKVIARWRELEAKQAAPVVPQTLSAALRLAADQAEQIELQRIELALAAPKVAFVESYVDSTGLKGFRQVAKLLQIKEPALRAFLSEREIMYRLGGEWHAYQRHIDAGRFEVKTGSSEVSGHAFSRSMFTPKGIEWLAGEWAKAQVRAEVAV
jgi:phage antirepressor YoqD-like protein